MRIAEHHSVPPLGVLDIGSNTVRLVLFRKQSIDLEPRWSNWREVFNMREPCRLGHGLAATGEMQAANLAHACRAIRDFRRALAKEAPNAYIDVLATAAVRDARNADRLINLIARAFGAPPRVLTGEEEAYYATLGVQFGAPQASGLFADLGGGSLELSRGEDSSMTSLPLGVLRLLEQSGGKHQRARKLIRESLKRVDFLHECEDETLHLVGGSWRAMATLHRLIQREPLPQLIEGYGLKGRKARRFAAQIIREKPDRMRPYIRRPDRADTLPYAALVLRRLIRQSKVSHVRFSQYGIREGLLVDWVRQERFNVTHDDRQFTLNLDEPPGTR
ncbi:MAG: hypothetical protein CMF26_03765 [Kiloniella sp.]|nr:hypothetical protein [Kiloniella sp.]